MRIELNGHESHATSLSLKIVFNILYLETEFWDWFWLKHYVFYLPSLLTLLIQPSQWRAVDAEIKVPSGENTELTHSPFKAWSKSVYSHTCYAYCQGFFYLAYFYTSGPFTCIFSNLSRFFLCWLWLTHGSCVGPRNKTGHPAGCRFLCWVPAEYK